MRENKADNVLSWILIGDLKLDFGSIVILLSDWYIYNLAEFDIKSTDCLILPMSHLLELPMDMHRVNVTWVGHSNRNSLPGAMCFCLYINVWYYWKGTNVLNFRSMRIFHRIWVESTRACLIEILINQSAAVYVMSTQALSSPPCQNTVRCFYMSCRLLQNISHVHQFFFRVQPICLQQFLQWWKTVVLHLCT